MTRLEKIQEAWWVILVMAVVGLLFAFMMGGTIQGALSQGTYFYTYDMTKSDEALVISTLAAEGKELLQMIGNPKTLLSVRDKGPTMTVLGKEYQAAGNTPYEAVNQWWFYVGSAVFTGGLATLASAYRD